MDAIEVQVRSEPSSKLNPVEFRWRGQTYFVQAIGRRWNDSQGLHILVQAGAQQVYELLYQAENEQWCWLENPIFPVKFNLA